MSELDDLLDPGITQNSGGQNFGQPKQIPNATAILVLGIISIVGCILYGIPGLVCGIIALAMYKKVKETYETDPAGYDISFKNAKAGMICAVIGTSLSAIYLLIFIFGISMAASGARF